MPDKPRHQPPAASLRLEGWDSIAGYLGVHRRTARAWCDERGLPVHQMFGKGGRVFATAAELDQWRAGSNAGVVGRTAESSARAGSGPEPVPGGRRVWLAFPAALLLALLGALFYQRPMPEPRSPGRLLARLSSEGGRLKSIPLADGACFGAVTPDGARIVVAPCVAGGAITVLSSASDKVTAQIAVSREPNSLAMDSQGKILYVGDRWGGITMVDMERSKVVGAIPLEGPVADLALSPDGTLYATRRERGLVSIRISDRRTTAIAVTGMPMFLALNPDGSLLYISYQGGGPGGGIAHDAIDVYDTKRGAFVANIAGQPRVGGPMTVSRSGLLVASGLDACWSAAYKLYSSRCPVFPGSVLSVIRASDSKVLSTLGFRDGPSSWAGIVPDGSRIVVVASKLRVVDTASFGTREAFPLPGVTRVLFAPDGRKAWALRGNPPSVAVLDTDDSGCLPAPRGLVGWWPGDGTEHDARGINDGVWHGTAAYAPGLVGQAFLMDGKSYLSLGGLNTLATIQPDFTAMAWVRFSARGAEETVVDRAGAGGFRVDRDAEGRLRFLMTGFSGVTALAVSTKPVPENKWLHVAAIRASGSISLLIDGVVAATARLEGAGWDGPPATGEVRIGSGLRGLADEVQWYNEALAEPEVAALARARGHGVCAE